MKIISDFHDYYDGVQRLGFDDRTIYQRKHQVLFYDRFRSLKNKDGQWIKRSYEAINDYCPPPYDCCFVVSFCGKIYQGYQNAEKKFFTYDPDDIKKLILSEKNKVFKYYADQLDDSGWEGKSFDVLHQEYKTPAIVKIRNCLHLNPPLKTIDFNKALDAYTTFQEIEMYLANQGHPEPEIVEISDKSKLIKHGHDLQYSFRKLPTKKRR